MGYIHNVQGKDHTVTDKDGQHFVIDAITRQITNNTGKVVLTKLDHNSECFTFEIPGEIEGHDMSDCNVVEVHYINIDSSTRAQNADVYTVEDFAVNEEKKGTFSWIVSRSATQYAGTLNFAVHFACYPETEEGADKSSTPLYSWRTGVFSGISIIDSVFSAEQAIDDYSDILQSWWNKIESTHEDVYMITDDGFILNLTDSMENLTGRVGTLETEVSGLKTADTTMAGKVETLETEVSGLKTSVSTPLEPPIIYMTEYYDQDSPDDHGVQVGITNKQFFRGDETVKFYAYCVDIDDADIYAFESGNLGYDEQYTFELTGGSIAGHRFIVYVYIEYEGFRSPIVTDTAMA